MMTASMGFTIDMHYCGGKMQSYSLFGEAESCMAMDVDTICTETDGASEGQRHCTLEKKKCCEDQMLYVQPVENLNIAVNFVSIDLDAQAYAILATFVLNVSLPYYDASFVNDQYRPPVLLRTTPVVLQSFMI